MPQQKIQMIGIPFDGKSSYMRGAANGPEAIRQELATDAYNEYNEHMVRVLGEDILADAGNIEAATFEAIRDEVSALMHPDMKPLFLGGDHSISFPLLQLINERHGPVHILHFDAHSDLYPDYFGDRYSHACPFARILESGLCKSLTQVGIRASTPWQQANMEADGVRVFTMRDLPLFDPGKLDGPLYISLDMDCFDPAFAPGVSHRESGGMTPRQVIDFLHGISVEVVGADLVEFNPLKDYAGITAALGVKMVKELAGLLLKI